MTEVLVGQSYYLRFDVKLWDAMQPYPPLGTLYAISSLRKVMPSVALFDAMLSEGTHEWQAALTHHQPKFAVIYEDNFNYLSKMSLLRMREACFEMIHMAKAQKCVVIVAGADMTDHAPLYLQQGADFVLHGDGEITLTELLPALQANAPTEALHNIRGIVFNELGNVVKTPPRKVLLHLDELPFPSWDLVDIERYRTLWMKRHGYFSMNLVTTRGCPFHCNWCAKPIWGQSYASHSPQTIVQQMRYLKDTYQPDHIWFMDDIMGIRDLWIEEFADELDKHNAHIPFKSLNRADLLLRGKTIPALKRAGADIIWIGAESGSQNILDAMDKGTKVSQIYEATRQLHAHGIKVAFFLQFGYTGETRTEIDLTLKMVRDLLPDDIGISVSYPLPGTPFYERVRHELSQRQNWYDSQDLAMLYHGTYSTAFYRQLHTVVHKDYRSRKAWQLAKTVLKTPTRLRMSHLRQFATALYHRITLPLAMQRLNQLASVPPTTPLSNVTIVQ